MEKLDGRGEVGWKDSPTNQALIASALYYHPARSSVRRMGGCKYNNYGLIAVAAWRHRGKIDQWQIPRQEVRVDAEWNSRWIS